MTKEIYSQMSWNNALRCRSTLLDKLLSSLFTDEKPRRTPAQTRQIFSLYPQSEDHAAIRQTQALSDSALVGKRPAATALPSGNNNETEFHVAAKALIAKTSSAETEKVRSERIGTRVSGLINSYISSRTRSTSLSFPFSDHQEMLPSTLETANTSKDPLTRSPASVNYKPPHTHRGNTISDTGTRSNLFQKRTMGPAWHSDIRPVQISEQFSAS